MFLSFAFTRSWLSRCNLLQACTFAFTPIPTRPCVHIAKVWLSRIYLTRLILTLLLHAPLWKVPTLILNGTSNGSLSLVLKVCTCSLWCVKSSNLLVWFIRYMVTTNSPGEPWANLFFRNSTQLYCQPSLSFHKPVASISKSKTTQLSWPDRKWENGNYRETFFSKTALNFPKLFVPRTIFCAPWNTFCISFTTPWLAQKWPFFIFTCLVLCGPTLTHHYS